MTTNRRFSLDLQPLTELNTKTPGSSDPIKQTAPAVPTLDSVLAQIGPIPTEALFLGMAPDGLPVLLNLHDPHPGPILIAGDAGCGKTAFLQTIAQSVARTHGPDDIQFGIVTNYPDEWESMEATSQRAGIFPVGHQSTHEFIHSLAAWAHSNKNTRQCILLLVDDLESVASLELEAVQDFRWLLLRGPARRVWPIVTMNAGRYGQVIAWLQNFRTRIFGHIANGRVAEALGADKTSGLNQLEAGNQFTLRETRVPRALGGEENWLRFWLPSCS